MLSAIIKTLRGERPTLKRPLFFVAFCGALAWLGVLSFLLLNGLATMPSMSMDGAFAERARARFVRDLAILFCVLPFLFPLGSLAAVVHRGVGGLLMRALSRGSKEACGQVATYRAAAYPLFAIPILGVIVMPIALLILEHRLLRHVISLSLGKALFVQFAGRFGIALFIFFALSTLAAIAVATGFVAEHVFIGAYYCLVKLLFYGELCGPSDTL